ncbi:Ca-transporting ATPase [Blastocladiella britannica]|nr:Ca-transporting ATPase [Blastocladiella britannica]
MESAYRESTERVLAHFGVDPTRGLTAKQVAAQKAKYGDNALPEDPPTPLWKLILEQFQDQLVIILLLAAVVSFALACLDVWEEGGSDADGGLLTAFVEPLVILLILIANAAVGVVQESNAEKAIEALKEYSPDEAKVLRDGHVHKIASADLVPGDIIELAVGDKIPADARVLSITSSTFRVDQAILTGESVSVTKETVAVNDAHAVNQDKINTLFSGTTITLGKARAIVVHTGSDTAIGAIHTAITETESERSPLKKKLDEFGDWLAKAITVVCILVWVINVRHFGDPLHHGWLKGAVYYFKIAVALAVAAIPEGLAVVITTCLALGTKKMAKKNAIVRSLPSVETLGCTSVICSDKTGTLTTNQMSVCDMVLIESKNGDLKRFNIEGTSFAPYGAVSDADADDDSVTAFSLPAKLPAARALALVCAQCNDASIVAEVDESDDTTGAATQFVAVGEPTDAALKVLVEKLGTPDAKFNAKLNQLDAVDRAMAASDWYADEYEKVKTFEFSRDRKSMSVVVKHAPTNTAQLLVKGAPESVLDRCSHAQLANGTVVALTPTLRDAVLDQFAAMGRTRALRVLACATTALEPKSGLWTSVTDPVKYVSVEQNLTFVGLAGMMDPPRPQVRGAIDLCHQAGIRVIVITGDNKNTAEAICRAIGVFGEHQQDLSKLSYTGREWDAMPAAEKLQAVSRANLFSRVEPTHKQELVELLQRHGAVVAMTGDGVNDAPALKRADIGVAMGSGTDVAKLAADMVLADDNFATIVSAVEEGRSIYNNTKQFIRYLISSNIGEVVAIFLTVLLGMPEALIPVQLLWVNLVTDGLPATALGFNPPDPDIMQRPPRKSDEKLVGRWLFFRYMVVGAYVGGATVFGYAWWYMFYANGPQLTFAQLSNYTKCSTQFPEIGCDQWFGQGIEPPKRATTVSLSVLVVIEMLNAMNSLSENASLLQLPLWRNWTLIAAITLSMILHFVVLYVPFFTQLFNIVPLNWDEWMAVLAISAPIILIDEVLKWVSRTFVTEYALDVATEAGAKAASRAIRGPTPAFGGKGSRSRSRSPARAAAAASPASGAGGARQRRKAANDDGESSGQSSPVARRTRAGGKKRAD